MTDRKHWVYRAYDEHGICLYVGCTVNLKRRRDSHRGASPWFDFAHHFRLTGPLDRDSAYALEEAEIASLDPCFNKGRPWTRSFGPPRSEVYRDRLRELVSA